MGSPNRYNYFECPQAISLPNCEWKYDCQRFYIFLVMLTADHQLHGRACCGYRVIWNCFSGTWILIMQTICVNIIFFIFHVLVPRFCQAKCLETGETVAIKKVLQDRRYKNRELQLMRTMDHPNVISLKHCFFSTTSRDELFLNLVMEYVPETMYRVLKHYSNAKQRMPLIYVKLYTYQVCAILPTLEFGYIFYLVSLQILIKLRMYPRFSGAWHISTVFLEFAIGI